MAAFGIIPNRSHKSFIQKSVNFLMSSGSSLRGGFDNKSPEPKEEIFPESSLPDHAFQISVCRRHKPEIARDFSSSSDRTEAVLLNDP
jgi:hypothetical protein